MDLVLGILRNNCLIASVFPRKHELWSSARTWGWIEAIGGDKEKVLITGNEKENVYTTKIKNVISLLVLEFNLFIFQGIP